MLRSHVRMLTADEVRVLRAPGESVPPAPGAADLILYEPAPSVAGWLHDEAVARCCSVADVLTSCAEYVMANTLWTGSDDAG